MTCILPAERLRPLYYYWRFPGNAKRGYTERCHHRSSELQSGNNSFREQHPGRSRRWATRTTKKLKRSVVSPWFKKKKVQRPRLKEDTWGFKQEDFLFVSEQTFLLTAKMVNSCKSKITKKERKTEWSQFSLIYIYIKLSSLSVLCNYRRTAWYDANCHALQKNL